MRPHTDEDGLVTLLVQLRYCDVLTDGDPRSYLHAHLLDEFELLIQHILRQPIFGYAYGQHASSHRQLLEHCRPVAEARQKVSAA